MTVNDDNTIEEKYTGFSRMLLSGQCLKATCKLVNNFDNKNGEAVVWDCEILEQFSA
jgi:hypothetical protein